MKLTAREIAAQCWCTPKTKYLTMFPDLAQAFADKLEPYLKVLEAAKNERLEHRKDCLCGLCLALGELEE